jgi:hypothetical protein
MLDPWLPFFLTEMFFESLTADLQNDVAQLELGIAENLVLRFADQKPSHLE